MSSVSGGSLPLPDSVSASRRSPRPPDLLPLPTAGPPPAGVDEPLPSPFSFDPRRDQFTSLHISPPAPSASDDDAAAAVVPSPLFLGLDLSTQALKASFADEDLTVVAEYVVHFDADLAEFGTTAGVLARAGGVVASPVAMWLKAIDVLFARIQRSPGGPALLSRVVGVSGAAQQHASVFWSARAPHLLASLDPAHPLVEQLGDAFASPLSPNWQDSSTTDECREMEAHVGGASELTRLTGSRAHERFTGPQILRLRRTSPAVYDATDRISLASSFLTTVFCADGEIKPFDESDACGMNLWHVEDGNDWHPALLACVAGGDGAPAEELKRKLGPVQKDGGVPAGKLGPYFVQRYGFPPECVVCTFTGDNPATLLSFSLLESDCVVSLGTSDTILLSTTTYAPSPDSHVFAYPANRAGGKRSYMAMLCYKNGSLPREAVRDAVAAGSWDTFGEMVAKHAVSLDQTKKRAMGFYFLKPEIIPHGAYGTHRFGTNGERIEQFSDPTFNCRAVLESQMLSFRLRSSKMLKSSNGSPHQIYAVGGAAANPTILSLLSTVLGAPVLQHSSSSSSNSCSVGGCMKALWCWLRVQRGDTVYLGFEDAVQEAKDRRVRRGLGGGDVVVARPDWKEYEVYGKLLGAFAELENKVCLGV